MKKETVSSGSRPLLLEIKGNSLDDGPGIRSVVFFKGCPLSCQWCHNPESKSPGPEISYDPAECIDCGTCMETCPDGAINRKNPHFIDRDRCSLCYMCVDECPSGALSRVGKTMTVEEILEDIEKDIPFFNTSGGGVTLSGGEPTMFPEFTSELARGLRDMGINILLETCGLFKYRQYMEKLDPFIDMVYFDIKIIDPADHKRYCGADNTVILENFSHLHASSLAGGTPIIPRTPLVPGITDTFSNLSSIAAYLYGLGVKKAALLEYNPLWGVKCDKIGVNNPLGSNNYTATWMEKSHVEDCRDIFLQAGIDL